ncbi:hypothetical protein DV735_g1517, partial [Chaetothyriales sp. CBS 134920]
MAIARRPTLAAGDWRSNKKSDEPPPGNNLNGASSVWRAVRQLRRRRIVLALLVVWLLYLFIHHIPTNLPPVSKRFDQYGAQRPTRPQPPPNKGAPVPADGAPPPANYEGVIRFHELPVTLSSQHYDPGAVLFAFSSLRSASPVLAAACAMARRGRARVHIASMGRQPVDKASLLELNGIAADDDCPLTWHNAQPDFARESSEARMSASVEAALGYLHKALGMQAVLVDHSPREDTFFRAAVEARTRIIDVPALGVPDHDAWMLALDAAALRQWNQVSIEIVIRAPTESSASLVRLLKSIQRADYSALSYPKLTIEMPAVIDQSLGEYVSNYQWPPGTPVTKRTLTLRRRVARAEPDAAGAAVLTLESFYPSTVQTHVLVLSPDVELSDSYYHLLLYLILDAKHSARSSPVSDQLLGISLDGKTGADGGWALTQATSEHAALYFGDKWIQLHNYVTLRLQADPEWRKSVETEPGQPANTPAWIRATGELMQAMSYFMLEPVFATGASPLVTVHTELQTDEASASTADENQDLGSLEQEDGHLVLKVTGSPLSSREKPMLSASSVLGRLAENSDAAWSPDNLALFDTHRSAATAEEIDQRRSFYTGQLAQSVGGCTSPEIDVSSLTADSMGILFCG